MTIFRKQGLLLRIRLCESGYVKHFQANRRCQIMVEAALQGLWSVVELSKLVRQAVKERYLPPAHESIKMNEFFSLRQGSLTLEQYFLKFATLSRYAPHLSIEQQIARFCQGLNSPLDMWLEAMQPTSIQDTLIRANPLVKEIERKRGNRRREAYAPCNKKDQYRRAFVPNP